jgi:hypothetical protein
MTNLTVACGNFANVPKKSVLAVLSAVGNSSSTSTGKSMFFFFWAIHLSSKTAIMPRIIFSTKHRRTEQVVLR